MLPVTSSLLMIIFEDGPLFMNLSFFYPFINEEFKFRSYVKSIIFSLLYIKDVNRNMLFHEFQCGVLFGFFSAGEKNRSRP